MKFTAKKKSIDFAVSAAVDHKDQLHAYLRRRLNKAHDVDDLAQEVYLRLLSLKDETKVGGVRERMAYIYTVASRVVSKYWTEAADRTVSIETVHLESEDWWSEDDPAERVARQQHIQRVFEQLPRIQAAALLLHERDGMSYKEIAQKLNLTVEKVHYHIMRAKARIQLTPWER